MNKSDCAAIFSGGLDSTTLVYELLDEGRTPHLISFDYGQRHKKELEFAQGTANELLLHHDIIDLSGITHLISNSALTSQLEEKAQDLIGDMRERQITIEVPDGHYAQDNMKLTVVPNRNMIMLSIAAGIAINNNYQFIATGVHAGDHFVYPDCRPSFITMANAAIVAGNEGFGSIPELPSHFGVPLYKFVHAPFLNNSKADIAFEAIRLGVPLEGTWSCYKGGDKHCGKCGTCVERLEAIAEATTRRNEQHGVDRGDEHFVTFDRTEYEDTEFWKGAVANA